MELKEMTIDELRTRLGEIRTASEAENADLDQLEAEAKSINEEIEARAKAEAEKVEIREQVAEGNTEEEPEEVEEAPAEEERTKMDPKEVRNSSEYIEAFAEYIKTEERSAILSENATNGQVAVPELVYGIVQTAWNKEGIMSRVKKAYLKGNLKVGFEISATGAVVHTEGTAAPEEETLVLGIVEMVPKSLKKWITVSDEVYDLRGEEFLNYIYSEVAYQIAQKAAQELIGKIEACGTQSTTTCVGVAKITVTSASMGTVAQAIANLSDEVTEPCIIMNKLTYADFKAIQYANGYGADPFEGLPVLFNNNIASYAAATTGVTYMIVGDLANGALANFPNGEEIKFKFDDTSLAEKDLVKIVGREYVAVDVIKPYAFCKVAK